jgi:AcrR family transcriptional regulator
MEIKRRTQEQRSAATRDALISAARRLWGERGYAEVGTPEIATVAGVTRGAMYHQFADKAALFREVVEVVEQDVMARMGAMVASSGAGSAADAIRAAVDAWLEVSADPEVRQLILLDAPSVLGWAGFRDVAQRYSLGQSTYTTAGPRTHRCTGRGGHGHRHRGRSQMRPSGDGAGAAPAYRRHAESAVRVRSLGR